MESLENWSSLYGVRFLNVVLRLIKCVKVVVNTAEGIKYIFLEQIHDENLIGAQLIIGLPEIINVSYLYVR
jgi:hypothetical protein